MLTSILFSLFFARDTCVFRPVDRDSLKPNIVAFKEQYEVFKKNGSNDYQLLYITEDELVYVSVNASGIIISRNKNGHTTLEELPYEDGTKLVRKFKNVLPGAYLGACTAAHAPIAHCLLIKSKTRIIFSFDGINQDIKELASSHDELDSILDLLKAVE